MSYDIPFRQDRLAFSELGRRAVGSVAEFLNARPERAVHRAVPPAAQRAFPANLALAVGWSLARCVVVCL